MQAINFHHSTCMMFLFRGPLFWVNTHHNNPTERGGMPLILKPPHRGYFHTNINTANPRPGQLCNYNQHNLI